MAGDVTGRADGRRRGAGGGSARSGGFSGVWHRGCRREGRPGRDAVTKRGQQSLRREGRSCRGDGFAVSAGPAVGAVPAAHIGEGLAVSGRVGMTLRRVFRLGEGLSGRVSFPALGRKSVAAAPGRGLSYWWAVAGGRGYRRRAGVYQACGLLVGGAGLRCRGGMVGWVNRYNRRGGGGAEPRMVGCVNWSNWRGGGFSRRGVKVLEWGPDVGTQPRRNRTARREGGNPTERNGVEWR